MLQKTNTHVHVHVMPILCPTKDALYIHCTCMFIFTGVKPIEYTVHVMHNCIIVQFFVSIFMYIILIP